MKHFPTSSLPEIFCSKLKDKVLVAVNLLIIFFCKSARDAFTEKKYMKKIFKMKNNFFIKIDL
tara:strand:- start:409 stop:597 length:189 start_codon:yes stop_codon:yes gene_type:complete